MAVTRIEFEKKKVFKMISIYCKGHKHSSVLCSKCNELVQYAHKRLDNCKFGNEKTFCSKCEVHCYKPEMRKSIKMVMRYSGPRILLHNPILALKHFLGK